MNNLPQKNVIYDTETKSVLPYKKENDVTTNSQNFRSNTINNIFSQLVDNDRFIENRILVSGKNMDGPKAYSDEQIASLENGSKILSSAASTEQLLILRKQDKGIQESMERVLGGRVNVLCRNGSSLLVGTSYGLFKTGDGVSYEKTYNSNQEQLTGDVTCIKVYPGTVFFGMDGDVYASSVDDDGNKFTFAINANDFGDVVNDLCYLPKTGELYVSADGGMFKVRIKNMRLLREKSLIFSQVCQIDEDGMIDPIRNFSVTPLVDENVALPKDLVAATEKGILAFDTVQDGLKGLTKVLNGETCYFADRIDDDFVLVGTYHGLIDGIGQSVFDTETPVACFCKDEDTRYYFSDSKIIKADVVRYGEDIQIETEEIPFSKSEGDYALGMFTVSQQGGGRLIVIHTRGGQLITFLPETSSFTVIGRNGIERAGQTDDETIYLVQGGQMYRYSVRGTGIQKSDDVSSVQMLSAYDENGDEIPFGEALKVVQDESGKSVVLTKKSIIAVDEDGTGRYMIPHVVDCDYVGMVKLQNPIKYNYYPISAHWTLYQQQWRDISDDVYEIDYTYAAVRGKDGKIFVDLVNGPEIVSEPRTSPELSGNCILTLSTNTYFNQDFQYPIDIKQDQDFLYVLATDGIHYAKNSDIEFFIQDRLSGDMLNKWFQVSSQNQMNLWHLDDSNSNNRIAKTGDEVFILSSGNILRAGFETFYRRIDNSSSWNSGIKNIIPIGELSQFYVVVENNVNGLLSDQVCCVCLTESDFERQVFNYSNIIIFPTGNERISDFCDYSYDEEGKNLILFSRLSVLSVNLETKNSLVLDNSGRNFYDTISGIYIEELSTRYEVDEGDEEEQYPVDYVIKAIKYELSSGVHKLYVNFISADFSGQGQPVSSLTSFDNLLTSISLTGYSGEYDNLSSISSLDSFHFPNGFVKIGKNISSMYFPTVKTTHGTYIYGTHRENDKTYVSCALDYEVVVSGFNRADINIISAVYDITEATKPYLEFDQFNFGTPTTEQSVLVTYVETDFDDDPLDFSLSGWLVEKMEFNKRKFSRNQNGQESAFISTDINPIIGNVEQFNQEDAHVEMFKDDAVIAKVGNSEQMYQLEYDQNGPKVEYLETILQWEHDSELVDMIQPENFNAVVSVQVETIPSEEDESQTVEVSTLHTTNMFRDIFGIDEENTVFVNQRGDVIRRDDEYFTIHGTSISGIRHMIDDDGRIYMTSSDNHTSSCAVYRFDGTGTNLRKIETIDFMPDQIFRDGKKIYATLSGALFKRGSDGDDHEVLSSGFVQGVNHVQTVGDTTMVATNLGIVVPTYKMQQGVDVKIDQIGTTALSSTDEIMTFYGNTVRIAGTKSNEQKKSLMSLDGSGVFVQEEIFGTDKFTNITQVKGTQDIIFSDGSSRLSILHEGNQREYPFGGNALSVIAANFQDGRTYVCTRNGLYFSDGFGPQDAFTTRKVNWLADISSCGRFLHFEDDKAMIPTNNGLYSIQKYPNWIDTYMTTYSIQGNIDFIRDVNSGYVAGIGFSVLSSGNDMQFQGFLETSGKTNDVYCKNDKEYYIATDAGLFRTSYGYKLVNDTYVFSEDELYDMFMDQMQEIKDEISGLIDKHMDEQHSENSFITKMDQELLSSDFSGVDLRGWSSQHFNGTSSEQTVDNDVVYDIEFGTNQNGDIHVQISNFLTSDSNPQFSYIRKHWYSGINELYIYLPTTYTYYISHADGSPDCQVVGGEKIQRRNLVQFGEDASLIDSSINGHHTEIIVTIPDTMAFRMDCILDVHINGNSLPLKIYRDEQFSFKEGDAARMYHSAILPSEVTYFPTSVDDRDQDGQYRFGFACFGQDAQAIRIMYYDSDSHVDENSFTIRYNGNGALGTMQDQVMRLAPNTGKHLRKCSFYWNTTSTVKIFLGWSFNPKAVQPDLSDGQVFEWREYQEVVKPPKAGSVMQLFAIWVDYNGDDGYTELIMDMDQDDEQDGQQDEDE